MNLFRSLFFISFFVLCASTPGKKEYNALREYYDSNLPETSIKVELKDEWNEQQRPGFIAKKDIKDGEILFDLPMEYLITSASVVSEGKELALALDKVFKYYKNDQEHDPGYYEVFTVYVLYHKFFKSDSKWKVWLDSLPGIEDMHNALFWSFGELKELAGSPLFQRARDRRAEASNHFKWLTSHIFEENQDLFPRNPTKEEYFWAVSVVRSRGISIFLNDIIQSAIAPYYDQFRHKNQDIDASYYIFNPNTKRLEVTSREDYKKGEEIFVFWGDKCNSELLDFYSFVTDDNEYDCVHIVDFLLPNDDPLIKEKRVLFERSKSSSAKLKVLKNGVTEDLLRILRAITVNEDEISTDMMMTGVPNEPITIRSEGATWQALVNACKNSLKQYQTTIEEDEKLLEDPNLPLRKRMMIKIRKAEKEMLFNVGISAQERVKVLHQEYLEEINSYKKDEL